MNNNPHKSITLQPYKIISQTTREKINTHETLNKIKKLILTTQEMVKWGQNSNNQNKEYYKAIADNAHPTTGEILPTSNNEIGRILQYKYQQYLPQEMLVKSRVERLINHNQISNDKAWGKKLQAFDNEIKISQGYKRTINWTRPQPQRSINLGAVNNTYASIQTNQKKSIIILHMVTYDTKSILYFKLPKKYRNFDKVCLPIISLSKENEVKFHFALEYKRQYPLISSKFVIGVDVGKVKPYCAVVMDVENKTVVETCEASRKVMSLARDIKITEKQIHNLQEKKFVADNDFDYWRFENEIRCERRGLSRKRRELAIVIAQEVVNISLRYDGAVVSVEDLSWIRNTMQNGRWNRGEQVRWIKHYCNVQGLLCYDVYCSNSSQMCYRCGCVGYCTKDRIFCCKKCGLRVDRDVNAAANMGLRVISRAVKSSATRLRRVNKAGGEKCVVRVPVGRSTNRQKCGPTRKRGRRSARKFESNRVVVARKFLTVSNFSFYCSCTKGSMGGFNQTVKSNNKNNKVSFDNHYQYI